MLRTTPVRGDSVTTDKAIANETETISLMRGGQGRSRPVMRSWIVGPLLHRGRLTFGQKAAVKVILSSKDRVVGVQGYAGTGKTTMLDRARVLAAKRGYRMIGLAPSASAAKTLGEEAGIETETLQRFLARNAGVAEGRLTRKGAKDMRQVFGENGAGGGRGLARLHRAGPEPAQDRQIVPDPAPGAGGRRKATGRGGRRKTLRAAAARGHEHRGPG